jgi:hypothetical protein
MIGAPLPTTRTKRDEQDALIVGWCTGIGCGAAIGMALHGAPWLWVVAGLFFWVFARRARSIESS